MTPPMHIFVHLRGQLIAKHLLSRDFGGDGTLESVKQRRQSCVTGNVRAHSGLCCSRTEPGELIPQGWRVTTLWDTGDTHSASPSQGHGVGGLELILSSIGPQGPLDHCTHAESYSKVKL